MLHAVLLEWEGVLADTGTARSDSLRRALTDEGVPFTAAAYERCCGGLDAHDAAAAALALAGVDDPTLAELVVRRASRAFRERLSRGFSLSPGAAELISAAAHRTRVAIVTRAERAETELALGLAGLTDAISTIVARDDVLDAPPSPALYAHALGQLARRRPTAPERVVALTDAVAAIRSGRTCGIRMLAVGAPAHVALEADAHVDDLRGLTVADLARLTNVHPAASPG
jgi:beta-phosphoglucomutase-like phosphatase (HAD superfamily)